jgi:hypothetical protein
MEVAMLSLHEVSVFLQYVPAPLQDIVLELRNIIASVAPDAVELIRWGGLSYCHEGRGGLVSAGICQIGIHADHVRLEFIHGVFLPDPGGLFEGTRKSKRYVRLKSYDDAPWEALRQLIEDAARFDPRSLQPLS